MGFFKNFGEELGTGAGKGTTTIISSIWKVFTLFCSWLFNWQHKNGEHSLHTNSFRIAVGSLILACFFVPGLVTCSFSPAKSLNSLTKTPGTVQLKTQLAVGDIPAYPAFEKFNIDYTQNVQHYDDFYGKKLFHYHQSADGKMPTIRIEESSCALIPAGMSLGIRSLLAPVYAANMENKVYYWKRPEYLTNSEYVKALIFYPNDFNHGVRISGTWIHLNENWQTVYSNRYIITVKALEKKHIDPNTAGGVVCF